MFAMIFVLLIFIPLVTDFLWNTREGAAAVEKRSPAKRPDAGLIWTSFADFAVQFERFYNDSFGLRQEFIRWNNLVRLGLFQESPVRGVRTGRNGWLFYANEWVFEDYENIMPYKLEDLEKIRRILEERRVWLANRGIRFFVVIPPNKHTVYAEYLPSVVHKLGKESRLDQVAQYLKAYPEIEFIDLRPALFKAKENQRLYHRTDTHWNDYGAFVGYLELMERIGKYFPHVKKLKWEDFRVEVDPEGKGGDLAGMLSLKDVIHEERINLVPKFRPRAVDGKRDYPDPVRHPGREMVIKETGDSSLPKALVFRDSYSWSLIPYLGESFQSAVFFWTFDFLPEIIEREKPDIVILECVERYINALTIENPEEVKIAGSAED